MFQHVCESFLHDSECGILDLGWESPSEAYGLNVEIDGVTPVQFRSQGRRGACETKVIQPVRTQVGGYAMYVTADF
jgi:hypothetical protein